MRMLFFMEDNPPALSLDNGSMNRRKNFILGLLTEEKCIMIVVLENGTG